MKEKLSAFVAILGLFVCMILRMFVQGFCGVGGWLVGFGK